MAKKPKIEVAPDAVEELVRRTKVYLERYKDSRTSTEAAAGLAWRDMNLHTPESTATTREREQLIRRVVLIIDGKPVRREGEQSRKPPRNRFGYGNAHAEDALPRGDR